jgi:hypothetical protein
VDKKTKVFISWSGEQSRKAAEVLGVWLQSVIQTIDPFVSSEGVEKGARWFDTISQKLEETNYGILILTGENLEAPWLCFEAGALAKSINKSRVSPFLFGVSQSDVRGPLLQFQFTTFDKADVKKLLRSINTFDEGYCIGEKVLEIAFERGWPELEVELKKILTESSKEVASIIETIPFSKKHGEILEEVCELVRYEQNILGNPEKLFPPDYIRYILDKMTPGELVSDNNFPIFREISRTLSTLEERRFEFAFKEITNTYEFVKDVERGKFRLDTENYYENIIKRMQNASKGSRIFAVSSIGNTKSQWDVDKLQAVYQAANFKAANCGAVIHRVFIIDKKLELEHILIPGSGLLKQIEHENIIVHVAKRDIVERELPTKSITDWVLFEKDKEFPIELYYDYPDDNYKTRIGYAKLIMDEGDIALAKEEHKNLCKLAIPNEDIEKVIRSHLKKDSAVYAI